MLAEEREDDIDIQTRKSKEVPAKWFARAGLVALLAYACVRLLHWLFDFPSIRDADTWIGCFAGTAFVGYCLAYANTIISEFRLRLKRIDRRLRRSQLRLVPLNKSKITRDASASVEIEDFSEQNNDNREDIIAHYRIAAEGGEAWAQYNLGVTYNNGKEVPKDNAQAAFWYRKAAEQGDIPSMQFLADLLAGGHGIGPDYLEAVRLYKVVADSGHTYSTMAEYDLGEIYAEGRGVPRDLAEAAKYWKRAAAHGWELAATRLEELYAREGIIPKTQGTA